MDRRVDERVAVHLTEAHELGALEARDRAQHAPLIGPLEARLEADQAVLTLRQVLLAQLHHGVRALAARRGESHRLHRSEAQRVLAAARQLLDRQAALEEERLLEVAQRQHLGVEHGLTEGEVLAAVHRRVEVVVAAALAVARGREQAIVIEARRLHHRRDGVVEVEVLGAEELGEPPRERGRGEWSGCDHDHVAVGQIDDFLAPHLDVGVARQGRRSPPRRSARDRPRARCPPAPLPRARRAAPASRATPSRA